MTGDGLGAVLFIDAHTGAVPSVRTVTSHGKPLSPPRPISSFPYTPLVRLYLILQGPRGFYFSKSKCPIATIPTRHTIVPSYPVSLTQHEQKNRYVAPPLPLRDWLSEPIVPVPIPIPVRPSLPRPSLTSSLSSPFDRRATM